MAKVLSNKSSRQSRRATKRNRKKRPSQSADMLVNFLMLALSVLVLTFIWSFWNRHTNNRTVAEEMRYYAEVPEDVTPQTLIAEKIYNNISVEILNGCGVSGLAALFKEIVHQKTFDVLNTENAAHFQYENTLIIVRTDKTEAAYKLAEELGISRERVQIDKDPSLAVDITMIIGHDYKSVPAYQEKKS
ncbi:MAG: LytR C-terminal domain-containing protein [Candidatus Marinimicrobia bacterium]|nr:LytR C-terminal domain-containing protein [Candidatus Neomarinimicrobiota bacterium]MCF7851458.1 LytR C-terminal domain-containing protein [Candidatus Neomarinimicrobiota bacterium]MCF7904101.1 LytR C-terminal domain-containing protein [Candidatus Neomarinimicrobiota bacterium]